MYLKLQPYIQSSIDQRACHKLAYKFFGPFVATTKIGAVAYRLKLAESSLVHPVLHVSSLKAAHLRMEHPVSPLPTNEFEFQVPLDVLEYRWRKIANKMVR